MLSQELPKMVHNGLITLCGALSVVCLGVLLEFDQEALNGHISLEEAKLLASGLNFDVFQGKLSDFF